MIEQGRYSDMGDIDESLTDVLISEVRIDGYVRLQGVDPRHVELLAECDEDLPPILIQRDTMQLIDGMHRLHAARRRGESRIKARLLQIGDVAAFMASVAANIAHGLPLSLADRKAAAVRLAGLCPQLSDRALARACGLSGKTVRTLRDRGDGRDAPPGRRVGLDGRARPLDSNSGREAARALLEAQPNASLRQIARQAGISPDTVRKVRASMVAEPHDLGPAPDDQSRPDVPRPRRVDEVRSLGQATPGRAAARISQLDADPLQIFTNLRQDPSILYRDDGRELLRLLQPRPVLEVGRKIVDGIPAHSLGAIAALAQHYADEWLAFSTMLERRIRRDAA